MTKNAAPGSDSSKPKKPLKSSFRSFDLFEDEPAAPQPEPEPEADKNIYDLGEEFDRAANDNDFEERGNRKEWSLEFEAEQERIIDAAKYLLPKHDEILRALEEASDLNMQGVIAAGLLENHYRDRIEDEDVDSMSAAALLVDADNFDDIAGNFAPMTAGIAGEIRDAENADDMEDYLIALAQMEPESKRVFIALQVADLEAAQEDLKEGRDGPDAEDHEEMAEMISAASDGVEKGLVRRAVSLFNEVSRGSGFLTNLGYDEKGMV
ncbi:MAG TPA: hypothetical protein VEF76_03955, partial [Patescibacteria group bacterium]|nr:hypothetical protein [Patescibacteria group bacterium]